MKNKNLLPNVPPECIGCVNCMKNGRRMLVPEVGGNCVDPKYNRGQMPAKIAVDTYRINQDAARASRQFTGENHGSFFADTSGRRD